MGAYILACVFAIPGFILTLGAGILFGLALGFVIVSISSTLGASASFLIGRYLARDWVAIKMEANPKFKVLDKAVAKEGWKIVGLARLSPVFPFNVLNYAFGLTNVRLRDFVLASWIGMFPGTVLYVSIGSAAKNLSDIAAGRSEGGIGQKVLFGVGLLATLVVTIVLARIAKKALADATQSHVA